MALNYVRVTFTDDQGNKRTIWAEDHTKPGSPVRRFFTVDKGGDRPSPVEIVFVLPVDVLDEKPAAMNLTYCELEVL